METFKEDLMNPATDALEKVCWLPEREKCHRQTEQYDEEFLQSTRLATKVAQGDLVEQRFVCTRNDVFDMSSIFNATSYAGDGTLEFPLISWSREDRADKQKSSFASRRSTSYPDTCMGPPLVVSPILSRCSSTCSLKSSLGKRHRTKLMAPSKRLMRSKALEADLSLLENDSNIRNSNGKSPMSSATSTTELSQMQIEDIDEEDRIATILSSVPVTSILSRSELENKSSKRCFRSSADQTLNECLRMLGERSMDYHIYAADNELNYNKLGKRISSDSLSPIEQQDDSTTKSFLQA